MQFFSNLLQSLYGPDYYRQIPGKSSWSALRYFIFLNLLLVLITVVFMAPRIITGVQEFLTGATSSVLSEYPANLQIQIKNGQVQTNVREPYVFALPESMKDESDEIEEAKNLLVIDTKTPYSQAKFDEYDTIVWLSKNTLYIDSGTQTRTQSLKDIDDLTINKSEIQKFIAQISPYFRYVAPFLIVMMFIIVFIVQMITLVYLWIFSVVFRFIASMFKISLTYMDAYKLTIHAATIGLVLDVLLQLLRPIIHTPPIPLMFTVVTLISLYINVLMQKELWNKKPIPQAVLAKKTTKKSSKASRKK